MQINNRRCWLLVPLGLLSCEPLHDLDAASGGADAPLTPDTTGSGGETAANDSTSPGGGASATPSQPPSTGGSMTTTGAPSVEDPGLPSPGSSGGGGMPGVTDPQPSSAGSGGMPGLEPTGSSVEPFDAGVPHDGDAPDAGSGAGGAEGQEPEQGSGGAAGSASSGFDASPPEEQPTGDAPELAIDLPGNPVDGTFIVSSEAEWEVEGVFIPTFEIHTPSASYWLVKDLGMIVSMEDSAAVDSSQWIAFSSGFRPLRGLPSFETFGGMEKMTTTLDVDSQTPTHLRLHSVSMSGSWRLVYDFYPTHVTLTVNAAPTPYGIAYRGVPAGALDSTDQFVRADGTSQGALISFVADLPGPSEWAYISDATLGRSLFMIQHADDALTDRYQVRDNDSASLSFGDGALTRLPARYSFGLIESDDHQTVAARAAFVIDAID